MLRQFLHTLDTHFGISQRDSNIREEFILGIKQAFFAILWGLVVIHILQLAGLDAVSLATFFFGYGAFSVFLLALLGRVTFLFVPSAPFSLSLVYSLVLKDHMTWGVISAALILAILTYWFLMLLGFSNSIYQAIPPGLRDSFDLAYSSFFFWWSLNRMGIDQIGSHHLLRAPFSSTFAISITGALIYGLFIWRKWRGGWILSMGIPLLLYMIFVNPISFILPLPTPYLPISNITSLLPCEDHFLRLLQPSFISTVLSLTLTITYFFSTMHKAWSDQRRASPVARSQDWEARQDSFMFWIVLILASLAPLLGIGLHKPYQDPCSIRRQGRASGFAGIVSGLLFLVAWFNIYALLAIPLAVLLIPALSSGFLVLLEKAPAIFAEKRPEILIPSLIMILLLPFNYEVGFTLSFGILLYAVLSLLSHREIENPRIITFLSLICFIIVVF